MESIKIETIIPATFFVLCILYEWITGNYKDGKLNAVDFKMAAISSVVVALIQRPLVMAMVFGVASLIILPYQGVLASLQDNYFWWTLLAYVLLEEYFHGLGHWFAHTRTPKSKLLRPLHKLFRTAHRPHHLIGNDDEKAQISVGQTFVEGWMYWLVMPNIWFSMIVLFLGLYEVVAFGVVIKGLWSIHVHVNWKYDLYLLNHPNALVRKVTFGLAHVFTFPNQHHQHHARGKNSSKNMHNFLSLYDWLIYDTLVIETTSPNQYGWRQTDEEKQSALYRFTRTYQ
ncbi:MAG: sterol desaturase [Pseudomonadales bacterium]|nr:sterol desaturase [Pseudomonadales bacterium]